MKDKKRVEAWMLIGPRHQNASSKPPNITKNEQTLGWRWARVREVRPGDERALRALRRLGKAAAHYFYEGNNARTNGQMGRAFAALDKARAKKGGGR